MGCANEDECFIRHNQSSMVATPIQSFLVLLNVVCGVASLSGAWPPLPFEYRNRKNTLVFLGPPQRSGVGVCVCLPLTSRRRKTSSHFIPVSFTKTMLSYSKSNPLLQTYVRHGEFQYLNICKTDQFRSNPSKLGTWEMQLLSTRLPGERRRAPYNLKPPSLLLPPSQPSLPTFPPCHLPPIMIYMKLASINSSCTPETLCNVRRDSGVGTEPWDREGGMEIKGSIRA